MPSVSRGLIRGLQPSTIENYPASAPVEVGIRIDRDMRDRLKAFARHKGMTEYRFCKEAGVRPNFLNWGPPGVSSKSLHKIGQAFPDLNLHWVATGEGEMLKADDDKIPLSTHRAIVEARDARIEQLEGIVAKLRAKIKELKNR